MNLGNASKPQLQLSFARGGVLRQILNFRKMQQQKHQLIKLRFLQWERTSEALLNLCVCFFQVEFQCKFLNFRQHCLAFSGQESSVIDLFRLRNRSESKFLFVEVKGSCGGRELAN